MIMRQTVAIVLTLALLSASALAGPPLPMAGIVREARVGASDFRLFDGTHTADVVVDGADSKTVKLAAGLFCDDIGRIGGTKARLVDDIGTAAADCVIVGSMKESGLIKKLASEGRIDLREIEGQWEACVVATVDKPFAGIERALVIAGSDRRGTAYGLFEISNQMGVSPWYFFADVAPKRKASVFVGAGHYLQRPPSVKYRGIFINDELWGIRPWALHTFAPEEGKGLGPKTNAKIFELLLRLKANTLWPAMHPKAKPFNYFERNKIVADEYGIVMGSSHIEPMLRNNIAGTEWDTEYPGEPWDYNTNREHIYQYWEKRVMENGRYENLYTVGKRGQDDEAGTDVTVPVLERFFVDQRTILGKHVNPDVTKVPQVLIMYTEVLGLYNSGLKVPDDVILCWPDDNFGYIRQLPSAMEQKRPGGSGVYYHFQWLNGATTTIWIVEDNEAFAKQMCRLINAEHDMICPHHFTCETELFNKLKTTDERPDLLLLDIGLPGRSGLQILEDLRSIRSELKVLILTSFDDREKIYRAITSGASGYLLKTDDPHEILAGIRVVLDGATAISNPVAKMILNRWQDYEG